jgi:hypothetical protein
MKKTPARPGTAIEKKPQVNVSRIGDRGTRARELDQVIQRGLATFVEVGRALLEIQQDQLYKEFGHRSFEDYCLQRWHVSRAEAYRKIDAAKVQAKLEPLGITLPNEHAALVVKGYVGDLQLRVKQQGQQPAYALAEVLSYARPKAKPKPSPPSPVERIGPPFLKQPQLGSPMVIVPAPDPDDEELSELAVQVKLLVERVRDLPMSRARTLLEPFEPDLLELLDILGYERDAEAD